MSDSITRTRKEYYKQWRAKNKDRVREYNRRYWQKRVSKKMEGSADGRRE